MGAIVSGRVAAIAAAAAIGVLGLALVGACSGPAPLLDMPSPARSAAVPFGVPSGTPSVAPIPTTGPAASSVQAPTKAELANHEIPSRKGAPGSTKGTISCGEKRCVAGKEVCRFVTDDQVWAWVCVPPEAEVSSATGFYPCDDGSDCPAGKTCCLSFASADEAFHCADRGAGECREEICAGGEEGAAECPKGRSCSSGMCLVTKPPGPTCQGKVRCPAEKPVCKWAAGKGECVSEEKLEELWPLRLEEASKGGVALLACTRNADCGPGGHCCTGFLGGAREARCGLHCDMANSMQYCDSDADCPKDEGLTWKCKSVAGSGSELPSWSKTCQMIVP